MGQAIFVIWRESAEALLVIGILHAWIRHSGPATARALVYLWTGVALGLLLAVALGAALIGTNEFLSSDAQENFQTAMILFACALIVQMVLWMRGHRKTLKKDIEASLRAKAHYANWSGIALLAALAVAREGSETVIFLYGLGFGQSGKLLWEQIAAALIGFSLAFLTFYLLQLGGKYLSWRRFFGITEIMLLFLACGLCQSGVDKLIDKGVLPLGIDQVWDSSMLIDDASPFGALIAALTGYRSHPSLTNLIACFLYWTVILLCLQGPHLRPRARSA